MNFFLLLEAASYLINVVLNNFVNKDSYDSLFFFSKHAFRE